MESSEILISQLKTFEGLRLQAYRDSAGVLTIGYGHTGPDISEGDRISEYWATELLSKDLGAVEAQVRRLRVARTQGQFDALVSFVFNLGIGRLQSSTLLKLIRQGRSRAQIRREFKRWVYAGGRKLAGLERRREWEANRFFE
ncbi:MULTISPECIES: lysozyme [unclassified Prevotella]|uniref:lysozyme n=1 Tax=unclassified Prevotella TaxID=2638335 RepID=UPI00048D91BA|nr:MULTISPECIES: lysozyme [unclassified Prevotella]